MRILKRILIVLGIVLCLVILTPVLALLGFLGYYHHVVSAKPGALAASVTPGRLGSNVNPFSATGGYFWMCGHDTPAATTPFGMVRLGPDTASILINQTGLNRAGYFYGDNKITGFSHTRLVGADALEGGVFRVFPTVEGRADTLHGKERFARFSHGQESAFPGYYEVWLPKDEVLAELTATPRVGVHRYTFRGGGAPHLLVDITSVFADKRAEDGVVMVLPQANELEGSVKTFGSFSGRYDGLEVYFAARFNRPFTKFGTWAGDKFTPGADSAAGKNIGADLAFEKQGAEQVVELRLAISYVSIQNARANLEAEAAGKSFEDVYAGARDAWEKRFAMIRVQGGTEAQERIFYTSLYHAFQMPTVFADVTGDYKGFDRAIHKTEGFQYYTDFSLWDTFRTVHPLYYLVAPGDARDMMVSLVEMAKAGGCLPRWPSGCGYTNCMFGTPADIAVTEAYLKGIRNFDAEAAYAAMRETGLTGKPPASRFGGRDGLEAYLQLGYCPSDKVGASVAKTLEYSYADYAISLFAAALGHKEDAELFTKQAQSYRNVWNPETRHFEGKDAQGNFPKARDFEKLTYIDFKREFTGAYVEGSGEQWRWSVPFDGPGLISLFPNKETFISELEKYMSKATPGVGAWNPGPYYWHGNEPYIHAAYLFNEAGRPDLTQKWVRWILDRKYADDYAGLDGNDDGGTLSAWYVFSALGFYPLAGTTKYWVGSPLFSRADIQVGDKTLTMIANNNSPENVYVQKVVLNGKPLEHPWFTHGDIAGGGELRFEMGPAPAPL